MFALLEKDFSPLRRRLNIIADLVYFLIEKQYTQRNTSYAFYLDMQDMAPYVPLLIPDLQQSLIDPLPEVRATAAKAIGSLLQGMGEHHSQDLMPWLLATLKSEVCISSAEVQCQQCFEAITQSEAPYFRLCSLPHVQARRAELELQTCLRLL